MITSSRSGHNISLSRTENEILKSNDFVTIIHLFMIKVIAVNPFLRYLNMMQSCRCVFKDNRLENEEEHQLDAIYRAVVVTEKDINLLVVNLRLASPPH